MIADLLGLFHLWQADLVRAFLVFLRVGSAMSLMPAFGEQSVPVRVRLALAVMFTLVVMPMIDTAPVSLPSSFGPMAYLSEVLSGLLLGIFFRLFVVTLQVAGTMAAQATSLSQIFGGAMTPDPMPAFGRIFVLAGLTLAMMSGLHVKLALALAGSYKVFPVGVFPVRADVTQWGVLGVSRTFSTAFVLAAPFVLVSVVYNIAIGVINKAMPQLLVSFIGAPLITLGGLLLLLVTTPIVVTTWLRYFDLGLANPFGVF